MRYAPGEVPVLEEYDFVEIVRAPDGPLIKELSLVLNSVGIPHRVVGNQHQRWIVVPAPRAQEALEELSSYHHENVGRRRRPDKLVPHAGVITHALLWAVLLALVHLLAYDSAWGVDWKGIGRVDGAAVGGGELWRAFTALSLHADLNHLISNLFLGALFVALLAQVIGPASAWSVVLLGGGIGNLLNCAIRGPELLSLGASTAVFAALGGLTAVQFSRKLKTTGARAARWIPLVAGVLLLGWNGMGSARVDPWEGVKRDVDDNTDIGAHIAGFICGCLLGALGYALERRGKGSDFRQRVMPWLPPALFAVCWALALSTR